MRFKSKIFLLAGLMLAGACLAPNASAAVIAQYNFDADTEGWNETAISGLTTSAGFLTGTATGNDPQLKKVAMSLTVGSGETWSTLVFRVRETQDEDPAGVVSAFDPTGLIVQANTGGGGLTTVTISAAAAFTAVASGDGFFTVTADISGIGTADIVNLRLDPIGGAASNSNSETNGNFFEVDFIQINSVPEPSAALLGGLGLLALLRRRR